MTAFHPLRTFAATLAAGLLLPVAAAQASPPVPPPVPDVTALRLAALALGENAAEFLPGALPEGLELPLPEGARLYGSIVGEYRTSVLVDLSAVARDYGGAARALVDALLAADWQGVEPPGSARDVFATGPDRDDPPTHLCTRSRDRELLYSIDVGADLGAIAHLNLYRRCEIVPAGPPVPIPRLRLPDALRIVGGSNGSGDDSFEATVAYRRALEPEAIFDALAEQLTAQGWRVDALVTEADLVSARVTYEDDVQLWQGLLSVGTGRSAFQVDRLR